MAAREMAARVEDWGGSACFEEGGGEEAVLRFFCSDPLAYSCSISSSSPLSALNCCLPLFLPLLEPELTEAPSSSCETCVTGIEGCELETCVAGEEAR